VAKIHHFALKKPKYQGLWSRELFLKIFQKKSPHLYEENYEIIKIFGGFGQIFNFLLVKSPYLANKF
jgi:hypothetical protein